MLKSSSSKHFGTLIDRNLRIIKLNYLQAFKAAGINLTPEQWVILDELYGAGEVSQTDLANGSFKNAPTVSRIIDLLCKKGLTERHRFENDRRRHKIFLTEKGKATVEKLQPIVNDLRVKGWEGLSEEDYANFQRIMNKMFANYEGK